MWWKRTSHDTRFHVEGHARRRTRRSLVQRNARRGNTDAFGFRSPRVSLSWKKRAILLSSFLLAILALTGLIYLIWFSHVFDLREVFIVSGGQDKTIPHDHIQAQLTDHMNQNVLFLSTSEIAESLLTLNPRIRRVDVTRILPRTIEVTINEYAIVAEFLTTKNQKRYLLNEAGLVVQTDIQAAHASLFQIESESQDTFDIDTTAIPRPDLTYMRDAAFLFESKTGVKILKARYLPPAREVHFFTNKTFQVWFDFRWSPEDHIDDFTRVLGGTILKNKTFSILDLRIPGKAFLCEKPDGCGN